MKENNHVGKTMTSFILILLATHSDVCRMYLHKAVKWSMLRIVGI